MDGLSLQSQQLALLDGIQAKLVGNVALPSGVLKSEGQISPDPLRKSRPI
jgi:hypothetical protein